MSELKHYFRFPLQDRESRTRFALGCALMLAGYVVPILPGLLVYGYALQILRRSAQGEAPSMPAWEDWPGLLSLGFRGTIVQLFFTLPALAVFLVGFGAYFGALIPFSIASSTDAGVSDPAILGFLAAMLILMLSVVLGSVLLVLGLLPLPASIAHFAAQDRLAAAFHIREWWRILSANWLGYFVAFVVVSGIFGLAYWAFMILYSTLVFLCVGFLVIVPAGVYTLLVGAALFGEAYREGAESLQARSGSATDTAIPA
jgi:hypothetical protein